MHASRRHLLNLKRENVCIDDEFITPHFVTVEKGMSYASTVSGTRTRKKIA